MSGHDVVIRLRHLAEEPEGSVLIGLVYRIVGADDADLFAPATRACELALEVLESRPCHTLQVSVFPADEWEPTDSLGDGLADEESTP